MLFPIFFSLLGPGICYQAFGVPEEPKLSPGNMVQLSSYCRANQQDTEKRIVFKKIHARDRVFMQEHYAVRQFFHRVMANNPGLTVIRVSSATHAGTNLCDLVFCF